MDEKTEHLRDVFQTVTDGEETVTEHQEDDRGSLEADGRSVDTRLHSLVSRMRDRYDLAASPTDDALVAIARGFYEGRTDADLADTLDISETAVFEARMALHLVGDEDGHEALLEALPSDEDDDTLAARHDVSVETVRRQRRVAAATEESLRANHRYRAEFDSLLGDADLSTRLAEELREDGLEEATEGLESDVSF